MAQPTITIEGNIIADPVLRFAGETPIAGFTVAHTESKKVGDKWEDGETMFINCSAFKRLAENVVESLSKGDRVIVIGKIRPNVWEDKEGKTRRDIKVSADSVGVSLGFATAKPQRNQAKKSEGAAPKARRAEKPSGDFEPVGNPW